MSESHNEPTEQGSAKEGIVDAHMLDRLAATLAARKGSDPSSSYTAKLLAKGPKKCAQKFGEEAVELVIASIAESRDATIAEAADMLYHWLALMTALEIDPADVYAELAKREGVSGLTEKAARPASE
mgnify:FL=1